MKRSRKSIARGRRIDLDRFVVSGATLADSSLAEYWNGEACSRASVSNPGSLALPIRTLHAGANRNTTSCDSLPQMNVRTRGYWLTFQTHSRVKEHVTANLPLSWCPSNE